MKRFLSWLLTVALVVTMLPLTCVTAYAANYTTSYGSYPAPDASDSAHNGGKNSCTTVSEIKWMQAALNYCIRYKGVSASMLDVDGAFGAASANATKAFQRKYGLSADGWFGSGTIAKMKSVLNVGGSTTTTTATVRTARVTFNNQGATTAGTSSTTATYGKAMPSITIPKKTGYTFGGYFLYANGVGTQYYTESGRSARSWDRTAATTLYAKWTANAPSGYYNTSYGSYPAPDASDSAHYGGKNSCTTVSEIKWMQAALNYCIKYKSLGATPLTVDGSFGAATANATRAFQRQNGLYADGYFGAGTIAKMKSVLGLTAAAKTTIITFNGQGATTAGTASKTATYGQAMPSIILPKKTGYTFEGYFDSTSTLTGVRYYNANGTSARAWNKTGATATLYARWKPITATVTLNNQGATTAGTASKTATYGSAMPYITVPRKTGYTFGGYYTGLYGSGTQYYTAYGYSARTWDRTVATTLYAKWTKSGTSTIAATKTITTVTLNSQGATTKGTQSVPATKGQAMPTITIPKKTGYNFGGYYSDPKCTGTQYYTELGRSARAWDKTNATYTLYAKWTPMTTTVKFNDQGATTAGTDSKTATYDSAMPTITIPKKTGYVFGGYYSDYKCTGTQYYTELGRSARTWDKTASTYTLYAKWTPMTTTVTLDSQGADSQGTPSVIATYGEVLPYITEPRKEGYVFLGYYANKDGSGPRYDKPIRDAEGIGPVTWDIAKKEFTLYAKWTELDPFLRSESFNRTAFDLAAVSVSEAKAKSNQENNAAYDEAAEARGYLIQQSDSSFYGKLLYGADNTHDNVGCELMAMYNALKLTGHPVGYSYLTFQTETTVGAQMWRGAWGTNPYKLGGIMERNGATVTEYSSAKALDEAMEVGSVAVVSTWNNGGTMLQGVHTYTVQKLENGLWWYNYNVRDEAVLQSGKYVGIKDTVQATLEANNHYPAFVVGYIVE